MRPNSLYIGFILSILLPAVVFSQLKSKKPGSIEYLKFSNGFNGIVLGNSIDQVPNYELSYLDGDNKFDTDSCLKFAYKDTSLLKLSGDVYLDLIGLRTYKNKVVNIYLFFKRADGYKVLRNFLTAYGLFTNKPSDYVDIYNWNSSKINLSLSYEIPADLGVAIFTCNPLVQEMEDMKIRQLLDLFTFSKSNTSKKTAGLPPAAKTKKKRKHE
jgi:hypothetical protein